MQEGVKLRMELIDVRKIRENKMAVLKMDEYIADQMREIARAAKAVEKRFFFLIFLLLFERLLTCF